MLDKKPQIASGIIWQLLDDQTVTVSPQSGKIRVFNGVGTFIWQKVAEDCTITEIIHAITERYDVDHDTAQKDVIAFINELVARNILTLPEA
ncbi:MAG: hypothetical protein Kow0080_08630 [Candidatus Promineifilaceae bacterium]